MRYGAAAIVGIVAFVGGGGAYAYFDLQGNITELDVDALVNSDPTATGEPGEVEPTYDDAHAGRALNILVMGSDDRSGANEEIGGAESGMRSDTTLLFHISADRSRVEAVSIPRDTLVEIPSCPLPDGTSTWPQSSEMFNSAMQLGSAQSETGSEEARQYGVACTIRTVQELTGLTVDEFALVDFAGFEDMVNAIGGVEVCIAEPLQDHYTGLDLPAGAQVLDGTEALQLARARYDIGDGSDLQRIDRQQQLLTAMIEQVLNSNLLTDAPQLYSFMSAATQSLTTSPGLSQIPSLVGLALSLDSLSISSVDFITMPVEDVPGTGGRVRATYEADLVWEAMALDEPINEALAPETTQTPDSTSYPGGEPSDISTTGEENPTETVTESPDSTIPSQDATPQTISASCG